MAEVPRRVLAIGCHADDVEIGSGVTLLTLVGSNQSVDLDWRVTDARRELASN
jgi:hypothetical protein